MLDFFKKKTLEVPEPPKIEFLTAVEGMIEIVPPVPMRKAMPRWVKDTPLRCPFPQPPQQHPHGGMQAPPPPPMKQNVPDGMTTIKACAGIIDILKWGWMMPLWADHEMITYPDSHQSGRYSLKAPIGEVSTSGFKAEHSDKMPLMEGEYGFSPKLDSPWLIKTPPGYSIALLPLPFADEEFNQPWRVVPGIIDTDRYHNFNILLKWRYEGRYLMEQGIPMCVVVPFKRSDANMDWALTKITSEEASIIKASGKGGTGSGNRFTTMPYQKDRKRRELLGMEGYR